MQPGQADQVLGRCNAFRRQHPLRFGRAFAGGADEFRQEDHRHAEVAAVVLGPHRVGLQDVYVAEVGHELRMRQMLAGEHGVAERELAHDRIAGLVIDRLQLR
jgi:hypothetical protein